MAAANLMAVGDVDHIIDEIQARASQMVVGEDMGAINSAASVERILGYIAQAEQAGARILVDGRKQAADAGGYWVGPTVIDGITPDMDIAKEEVFGPVLSILRVGDLSEALRWRTATPTATPAPSTPRRAMWPGRS